MSQENKEFLLRRSALGHAARWAKRDFWARVDKRGELECWMFTGSPDGSGYAQYSVNGAKRKVHRIAWERTYGPIPPGLLICHRCDTPLCCNPSHLFLGTHKDNAMDRSAKGRSAGQRLTRDQIVEIRGSVLPQRQLAKRFDVDQSHICRIRKGSARVAI